MAESHLVVTVDKLAMVAKLDYRCSIQRDSVGIKAMELHVILQPVKSLLNAVLPEYLAII